ncbi:MAG TPA: short-chain dehydrogenase, partial [Cyanobacteria bacterium UBA11991]|nr:short-chain dehydrogenase [Cyanobacteria bacterium UBA11991]
MNILVTGASKGIGRVIAQELKTTGKIYVCARNEAELKSLKPAG